MIATLWWTRASAAGSSQRSSRRWSLSTSWPGRSILRQRIMSVILERDQDFVSGSLQRGVCKLSVPRALPRSNQWRSRKRGRRIPIGRGNWRSPTLRQAAKMDERDERLRLSLDRGPPHRASSPAGASGASLARGNVSANMAVDSAFSGLVVTLEFCSIRRGATATGSAFSSTRTRGGWQGSQAASRPQSRAVARRKEGP